ncbi:hypothetical protein B0H16DRAFT_1530137 [Mycena metata]|uniref:Uncharacterized protein n=1 Tax=Mycena metata TaxID=1033252 RepID=A0AAD7JCW9_9AGAR|nr:hypothetical protein B0H16DRAFT_1627387 [Mycena metata]KAJ7762242.1 hypothetical protein B0H16DRAFT_1530137 [Mycena metata]
MHTHSSGSPANYLRNDYSPLSPKSPTRTSDLVHIDYPRTGQTSGALIPHSPMLLHSRSCSGRFGHLSGIRSHRRHRTLVWIMRYHAYSLLIHLSVPYHFSSIVSTPTSLLLIAGIFTLSSYHSSIHLSIYLTICFAFLLYSLAIVLHTHLTYSAAR